LQARRSDDVSLQSPITAPKPADWMKAQGICRKLVESYADTATVIPRRTELRERAKKKLL